LQRPIQIHGIQCDISNKADCDSLVERVLAIHGRIDCLVNSAGIVRSTAILDIAPEELDQMLSVNLKGAFYLCQSMLKVFQK
jgi:NAD(P)-dependent dehydrogenase (short-subunit alcohol dehydrogenase family)